MAEQSSTNRRKTHWLHFHLTLGLSAGLLFSLLGVTGSLCLFREAIDTWLNPALKIEHPATSHQPLDTVFANVKKAHPARHGEWVLEMPYDTTGMITAWYLRPHETYGRYFAPLMVSVNPYSADVVASRFWGETFATQLADLHAHLSLGLSGRQMVGFLGLGLVASCLSGIYLWWPKDIQALKAMTKLASGGTQELTRHCHRWLGCLSLIGLLVIALSGTALAFPNWTKSLLGSGMMSHDDEPPNIRSKSVHTVRPIGITEAVAIARGLFPHAEIRRIATPAGEEGTYRITFRRPGEPSRHHANTIVWVDQWSGQIRQVQNPNKFSSRQTALHALWPLHTGETLSSLGYFFWFILGLVPAALFTSGAISWCISRGFLANQKHHFSVKDKWQDFATCLQANFIAVRNHLIPQSVIVKEHLKRQFKQLEYWLKMKVNKR